MKRMKNIKVITISLLCLFALNGKAQTVTDSLEFSKSVARTPTAILKGRVSGVRVSSQDGGPNSAVNVNIRGINTIHGDSQPLWIVNGVILQRTGAEPECFLAERRIHHQGRPHR